MIKIDVSNAIPKRLGTYLLGVIPGLVFELIIAFGDPCLAQRMIGRAEQIYTFGPYALLTLFVASCLAVGQTFFLLSWFADLLISFVYYCYTRYLINGVVGSDWLYRALGRLQGTQPNRNIFLRFFSRMVMWGRKKRFQFYIRPILRCQRLAAKQLLVEKYGIHPSEGLWEWVDLEWQVWLSVLGKQRPVFREAVLTMRIFLACGLAELSAMYISPALRNRYLITSAAVFIAAGCFSSLDLAKRRFEPMISEFARLVSVLAELEETNAAARSEERGQNKGPGLAIGTDSSQGS